MALGAGGSSGAARARGFWGVSALKKLPGEIAFCQMPQGVAPLAPLEALLASLSANNNYRLVRIVGAGHFFDDQLKELMQTITDFVTG